MEKTFEDIEFLLTHLNNQGYVSTQDIQFLREIVFHIDGLVNKLENNETDDSDIIKRDVIDYLKQTDEHLRRVLFNHEDTEKEHDPDHQDANNRLFVSLLNQLKSF